MSEATLADIQSILSHHSIMCSKLNILPLEVHVEHVHDGDAEHNPDDTHATTAASSVPCSCRPAIDANGAADGSGSDTETDDNDDGASTDSDDGAAGYDDAATA